MSEMVASLLRDAREPDAPTKAVQVEVDSGSSTDLQVPVVDGGNEYAEPARRISEQIERLLLVPAYLSRREQELRRAGVSGDALRQVGRIQILARNAWLAVLEQLLRDPGLEEAVIARMGESRFLAAKAELEEKLSVAAVTSLSTQPSSIVSLQRRFDHERRAERKLR